MRYLILFFISYQIFTLKVMSQNIKELKGLILDLDKQTALPYTNIIVLHKESGTVSNEKGFFSLDLTNLEKEDTISFQYVGYKTQNISIKDMDSNLTIYLKEEIINLSEAFVFSDPPKAKSIIKKILENKSQNYKSRYSEKQVFIRRRNTGDINHIKIDYKKNDIPELNESILKILEQKTPRHNIDYTDLLTDISFSSKLEDSIKIKPIKIIALKSKDISELDQIMDIFTKLFSDTKDKEYWKIKSGIISQKLEIESGNDEDTIKEKNSYQTKTYHINNSVKNKWKFSSMNDSDEWDFLYHTGNYKYTLVGGTRVNGEDVYIIDFTPKSGGKYLGRVYVSIDTYALIRADYKYDIDKTGTDIHLFGIGYTSDYFEGSIFFEKKDGNYTLKYLSKRTGNVVSFDRNISLIKKRERFFYDKELFELKVKFHYKMTNISSMEILVINNKNITDVQFRQFKEPKFSKIILVNQFNSNLWKGYSIIEPTESMKEYKKID